MFYATCIKYLIVRYCKSIALIWRFHMISLFFATVSVAVFVAIVCNVVISIVPGLPKGDQRIDRSILRSCLDSLLVYIRIIVYDTRLLLFIVVCQKFITDHRASKRQLKWWKVMTAELEELGKSIFVNEVHTDRCQTSRSLCLFCSHWAKHHWNHVAICSWYPVASCNAGAWDVAPASQYSGVFLFWWRHDLIWEENFLEASHMDCEFMQSGLFWMNMWCPVFSARCHTCFCSFGSACKNSLKHIIYKSQQDDTR